ncbi:hypothetical protein, partial [Ruthenibacterium lactatiformans]|uniref:hypothetical protein n=1 Tax=Ruthenibacterium lactatiformans TaxID=1550024 RepID=UPI001967E787
LGRSCVQTSFYHVGKITMDFFLGVQLHFTINQKIMMMLFSQIKNNRAAELFHSAAVHRC